jgi:hypothetical protein
MKNTRKKIKLDPLTLVASAEYYFEKGLRKVQPYDYVYQTFAKKRWLGRPLFEILSSEFRDRTANYYVTLSFNI